MRTPHNPQPAMNLGDDPDLAAEIGSRLAASSQTAQGLLTNCLFYGQRRTSEGDQRQRQSTTHAVEDDVAHKKSQDASAELAAQVVRSQRTELESRAVGVRSQQSGERGLFRGAAERPKLRLIQRCAGQESAGGPSRVSVDPKSCSDALASDNLADDPLSRDPLTATAPEALEARRPHSPGHS